MAGCALCGESSANMKVCSRCQTVAYCSKDHQKEHWKVHKSACVSARKAQTAPPSAAGGSMAGGMARAGAAVGAGVAAAAGAAVGGTWTPMLPPYPALQSSILPSLVSTVLHPSPHATRTSVSPHPTHHPALSRCRHGSRCWWPRARPEL
eukprot:TRINITY_DN850_c0_g1_i1.p2 TRINITY_DN850_c0_g1~~TRINITY_DN850_c0_g1_i1.p2  ORF type:complete len:150 (+),score=0.77 TRINITY_DN850_c0_g1_i1:221-670(+)